MSTTVTPRTTKTQVEASKRWSAPPRSRTAGRAVRSPDEVVRDVRGLKMRQRVSLALADDNLRGELEDIVSAHSQSPINGDAFRTYQDFLIPSGSLYGGGFPSLSASAIADIRGADTLHYSKFERQLRCKVASVYRLMQMFGWGKGVFDRAACTVCASENDNEENNYFVAPTGLLFSEVTASSILKVDHKGNVIETGNTNLGISQSAFELHATIHSTRKDAKCVLFLSADSVKAVSAIKVGLVPISQEGIAVGEVSYHTFPGFTLDEEARDSLINSFGPSSRVLILRNYGAICVGETIEETAYLAYLLVTACEQQLSALSAGVDELIKIDDEAKEQMDNAFYGGLDANENQQKMAEVHFEAWMRLLDSRGCKTGYHYRNPEIFKTEAKEPKSREAAPAKTSSARTELTIYRDANLRRSASLGRGNTYRSRLKWLNSPVKSTEYRRERELDNSEPALIKDRKPEKENKDDEEVFITTKVVSVNQSAPELPTQEVTEEEVTFVHAQDRNFSPQEIHLLIDDSRDSLDASGEPVVVELVREPVGLVRRKSGNKVKKRRSFRDKFAKRLSSGQ